MKIQYTLDLPTKLAASSLFIDSTTLINASRSPEYLNLLREIRLRGCVFWTIPSVEYEYTRSANTLKGYAERLAFIKELGITVFNRVEEILEKEARVFLAAYNCCFKSESRGPSYTDSLLCSMVYKHRNSHALLLTSNHKDVPSALFDTNEIITIDINGALMNEVIYEFSETKFSKVLSILEKETIKK